MRTLTFIRTSVQTRDDEREIVLLPIECLSYLEELGNDEYSVVFKKDSYQAKLFKIINDQKYIIKKEQINIIG